MSKKTPISKPIQEPEPEIPEAPKIPLKDRVLSKDPFYLTSNEADRLHLVTFRGKNLPPYLLSLRANNGHQGISRAYRILEERQEGYTARKATPKELSDLRMHLPK